MAVVRPEERRLRAGQLPVAGLLARDLRRAVVRRLALHHPVLRRLRHKLRLRHRPKRPKRLRLRPRLRLLLRRSVLMLLILSPEKSLRLWGNLAQRP